MKKIITIIFFCFLNVAAFCQLDSLSVEDKLALDSMLKQDELIQMLLNNQDRHSYLQVRAGIGNSYFSVRNRRINATQLDNKIVYTGSLSYNHKSGLGISGTAYLSDFEKKSGIYQFCLTPSFSYTKSKFIEGALSYTRFFRKSGFDLAASPIQNEFYLNANLKKPWIQPGIATGYSSGKYVQYRKIDTVLLGVRRIFIDTMTVKLSGFSINAFAQHVFEWYRLLNKNDGIVFIPSIYLNAGSDEYEETHENRFITKLNNRPNRVKNVGSYNDNNSLILQSVAANLDAGYMLGRFGFRAQAYFDYYLPETTDKRFTTIFSCSFSYNFYKK